MKRLALALAAAALAALPAAARPKMIAHRGAGDLTMPDASLPAFSNAVATACDIVKLDLRETKDGVVVLCHDDTLKRYMGLDATVADLTYAELLEKGTFKTVGGFAREKIVTLDQALAIVKDLPEFWLDFKRYSPAMADRVFASLARFGIADSRVMCATFTYGAFDYLRKTHPDVRRVAHVGVSLAKDGRYAVSLERRGSYATKREAYGAILRAKVRYALYGVNMPVLRNDASRTEPDDVRFLKSQGLWVSLWFVQDAAAAARYRAVADAFVTDRVSRVRE